MSWFSNLDITVLEYLSKLQKEGSEFSFNPSQKSVTESGKKLNLGFSCYALKILKLIGSVDKFSDDKIENWANYINSYQKFDSYSNKNSFIDHEYINLFRSQNIISNYTYPIKYISNFFLGTDYKSNNLKIENYIRAETKQSISTLYEINKPNQVLYKEFPKKESEINNFLEGLNWNYPWSSGGQFSAICVFLKTQLENENFERLRDTVIEFTNKTVNTEDGLYYKGNKQNEYELINGAMKVLTGLDWINAEIHYPEKIIDFCLNSKISNRGCDMVDVVYVLYRCSKETNHKKKEILNFCENILTMIKAHFSLSEGGFSYFQNQNQTHYYDVKIANEEHQADIHGTLLCVWAIVMIMDLSELDYFNYSILKP